MSKGSRIWLLLGFAACAGARPDRERQLDRSFAEIQVQEAHIAHAVAARFKPCEKGCSHGRGAHLAALQLCGIAREIADADALARCEQAISTARWLIADLADRCRATVHVRPQQRYGEPRPCP